MKFRNRKLNWKVFFKTARSVPETQKMHFVKVIGENELEFRYYSVCGRKQSVKY